MEKTSIAQIQSLVELANTSLAKMQQTTIMKDEEQPTEKLQSTPEDMSALPASTCSTFEESDKLENTPEDMSVQPISPSSKLEKEVGSTPGDTPFRSVSASSKLEDSHNGDKSEVTAEGPLAEEEAVAIHSAQIESNGSNNISVSTQLPAIG
ncbi:hypothetical protein B7P43_G04203, partial [Cryptotermes secundus]